MTHSQAHAAPPGLDTSAWVHAEQRVYDASPVGLRLTTAALFAALVGAYALAAGVDGIPLIVRSVAEYMPDRRAWIAACLSLLICVALGLQRYTRLKDVDEASGLQALAEPGIPWAPSFSGARLRMFAIVGALVGGGAMAWFLAHNADGRGPATSAWFTLAAAMLGVLFFRGVYMTREGAQHTRLVLRSGLRIDLLRIEQLYPIGRSAGRTASIWFTVSAASLLLLVGSDIGGDTLVLGLACAAMGVWVFVGTLSRVHHAIRAAKSAELERLRAEIDAARLSLSADPAAPARLQSLLAYEARIDAAPEWPFDQTILVRVGASALILTVPWFGQAFAGLVVDHFSRLAP
jgi:hypothetical protein